MIRDKLYDLQSKETYGGHVLKISELFQLLSVAYVPTTDLSLTVSSRTSHTCPTILHSVKSIAKLGLHFPYSEEVSTVPWFLPPVQPSAASSDMHYDDYLY